MDIHIIKKMLLIAPELSSCATFRPIFLPQNVIENVMYKRFFYVQYV